MPNLRHDTTAPPVLSASAAAYLAAHHPRAEASDWADWRWQMQHRLRTLADFRRVFRLSPPEEQALALEQRTRLRRAIRNLPEEFRHAVVLRDLEGLSYDEIARVLGVPIGTVRSRIARGRAALLEELS